jgi:tRNA U34 5-methylaminomethyl-2-thiouridine-forming methyltransferase MnmC
MYPCDICKKEFKTNQHLTQHKQRKKMCTLSNLHLNAIVTLPTKTSSSDLKITDILNFIKTAEDIQNLINDKKLIEEYKNTIAALTKENNALKEQIKTIQQIIQPKSLKKSEQVVSSVINDNENKNSENIISNNN